MLDFLLRHRLLHFFLTGGTGAALNLALTAALAELVFGREDYFYAYLIGLAANIVYNFVLHSRFTFRTQGGHRRRFAAFAAYNLAMTALQAVVVRRLVAWVGVDFYLPVIALVILCFSLLTYLVYRFWLFRQGTIY